MSRAYDLAERDPDSLRQTVTDIAARLRNGELDAATRTDLGARLVELAAHPTPSLRQAVAEAALHLSDDHFEAIIPRLQRDANAYVRRAAERCHDARSKRRRSESLHDQEGAHIAKLRARIEARYGTHARKLADALRDLETEFFVQKMHHELAKVATSLKVELVSLRANARRAPLDPITLAASAETAFAKYELLMSIVDAARSYTENIPAQFRQENALDLVNESIALLRDRMGNDAEKLAVTTEIDPALVLDADRGALMQAFSNILANAVEASAPATSAAVRLEISAKTQKAGTQVRLAFRDHGGGIAQASLAHVVEPFTSSKPGGRGLGLTNMRKMIESVHGGSFLLESEPGRGTTVTLVLPRKQART